MGSDVLARVRAEIDARLVELRPALAEYQRLLDAERALAAGDTSALEEWASEPVLPAAARRRVTPRRPARVSKAPVSAKAPRVRGRRGSAAGAIKRAASGPRDASQQAIVAALEHGSHTLGELVLVTAIAAGELRQGVRGLQQAGRITRTKREGRAAYALSSASTG